MDRRTLLTASVAVISGSVVGCLERRSTSGDFGDSGTSGGTTGTGTEGASMTDVDSGENEGVGGTEDSEGASTELDPRFEILGIEYTGSSTGSASVAYEDHTVTVTGVILGSNSCYTARLGSVTIDEQTLLVQIESYENAAADEGCRDAIVAINYEASVELTGEPLTSVRIKHNGEHVTTDRL